MSEYKAWFEAIPIPLMVWDRATFRYVAVNEAAVKLYGYSRDEFLRLTVKDIRRPEEIPALLKGVARLSGTISSRGLFNHRKKDGTPVTVEIIAHLSHWDGKPAVVSAAIDVTERRRLEEEILRISEAERRRIGRDLHDGLGPALTGISLSCKAAAQKLRARRAPEAALAAEVCASLSSAVSQVRSISGHLFPADLEAQGLEAALRSLSEQAGRASGVCISVSAPRSALKADGAVALQLYRIAQEAVTNALRHARASRIEIRLGRSRQGIALTVSDDGIGLPRKARSKTPGMGLRTMRYRSEVLGGSLSVAAGPKGGTIVRCLIPAPR